MPAHCADCSPEFPAPQGAPLLRRLPASERGWAASRGAVRAQVIDFGLAHSVDDAASPCLGTPEYIAPEMLVGAEAKAGGAAAPPQAVDVWGAGIVLYMLVAGRYPFQACRPAQAPPARVTCASVLPVRSLWSFAAQRPCLSAQQALVSEQAGSGDGMSAHACPPCAASTPPGRQRPGLGGAG